MKKNVDKATATPLDFQTMSLPCVDCLSGALGLAQLHEIATGRDGDGERHPRGYRIDLSSRPGFCMPAKTRSNWMSTFSWLNRIIGNRQPAVTQPVTHPNIRKYTASSPCLLRA